MQITRSAIMIVLCILSLSLAMPMWIYPIVISLFGFFGSGCIINQNLLMTRLGAHLGKGEVFGILMGVMTITASIIPALFGMIIDYAGFRTAFTIFSIPLFLSITILIVLLRSNKTKTGRIS